jgi:putative transposon-encoded protein
MGCEMTDKNQVETPAEAQEIKPAPQARVKFEVYGEEMIEKEVKSSGNSGRIYLPPNWVGHTVKIIKVE